MTFWERLDCEEETSNSIEEANDCWSPSAYRINSHEKDTETNLVSNISGKGRAVQQDQDFLGYSGEADEG